MEVTTTMKEQRIYFRWSEIDKRKIFSVFTTLEEGVETLLPKDGVIPKFKTLRFSISEKDEKGVETETNWELTPYILLELGRTISQWEAHIPQEDIDNYETSIREFKERQQQSNGSDK